MKINKYRYVNKNNLNFDISDSHSFKYAPIKISETGHNAKKEN